ncbi:unnamed protein product [Clonostachys solani]|uniref:HD domain-containing protein n=1 Tax=Clonostachys solani TaxID=160281 RepID=A0A9N9Z1F7_9HYPO|nr:unnamed protein product [Clonostachys solani]
MLTTIVKRCSMWVLLAASFSPASAGLSSTSGSLGYPTREIAGVSVVNTPLVRDAEDYAIKHSSHPVYKHVMRSWLYGVLMINANETLLNNVDLQIHAVSTLLHDLGWYRGNSSIISPDKRFEVDGANAARDFIRSHEDGKSWDERKVQLVWDAIALHTERSIAYFKELDVQVVSRGIQLDFSGPANGVAEDDYLAVTQAFPKDDLKDSVNSTFLWLCETKPATTYDTWMQPWGDNHVEGYNADGKRRYDIIFKNLNP